MTWSRKRIVVLVAGLLVLAGIPVGGIAYAFWSGSGSGSGLGTTGTTTAMTLSPGTPSIALYPGGQSNVVLTASNPNQSPIHIGSLFLDTSQGTSGYSVDGGHAGCATSALTYTTQTNGGAGWTVPAKVGTVDGTLSITLPAALAMSTAAANACQGASLTIYLAAS